MYANGTKMSPHILRRVWREITRYPQVSIRSLARRVGRSATTVQVAMHTLRDAGYIDFVDGTERTRTILVPFIAVKKGRC